METFTKGDVVLVPFPFSDLTQTKLRPAVVLARSGSQDYLLCQVTSNAYSDLRAVYLTDKDFVQGSLHRESYVRSTKLFTASHRLIVSKIGCLKISTLEKIIEMVVKLLKD